MPVFLATLGQRPEAITMALDTLQQQHAFDELVILHTNAEQSGIATALVSLRQVLRLDYPTLPVRYCELQHPDGTPLLDIQTQRSAESYYRAVLAELKHYREQGIAMHLLVAGGRKAMSIYATLAASLLFGVQDTVSTILTPPDLMQPGLFHAPLNRRHEIQVMALPLLPSRLLPDALSHQTLDDLLDVENPRDAFLESLTGAENDLIQLFREHPHATNKELGKMLNKSPRTVENQLRNVYSKMKAHFDITGSRQRDSLRHVLEGRI